MALKPILFKTEMVQAISSGSKTQTRRVVKKAIGHEDIGIKIPFKVGDVMWVKETFSKQDDSVIYRSDVCSKWDLPEGRKWAPSIFMPKNLCRFFLKVIDVRIERLQNISESDSIKEGVKIAEGKSAKEGFTSLWKSIHGEDSWKDDPIVIVYEFESVFFYEYLEGTTDCKNLLDAWNKNGRVKKNNKS